MPQKTYKSTGLTELESNVLAVIWRDQPITAYKVRYAFGASPTRALALSQGSIYPTIERLKKRGLVTGLAAQDGRNSEPVTTTPAGEEAVRTWLRDVPAFLPEDPLRNRILFMNVLTQEERLEWLKTAREGLLQSLADVEEFSQYLSGDFAEFGHDNARSSLVARIRWLERVEAKLRAADK